MKSFSLVLMVMLCVLTSAQYAQEKEMSISRKEFGKTPAGETVPLYTLSNRYGYSVSITPYGAIISSIVVPDRAGRPGDVVLGFDRLDGYLAEHPYFGCVVGRYANRIAGGRFSLDGREYELARNNGPNHLHGGLQGFDKRLFTAREIRERDYVGLELTYLSPDGEEGYPGKLELTVIYTWNDLNELRIEYRALSDQPTICNLTQHSYFNLADAGAGTVLDHLLKIDADSITPVDETLIPTGEFMPVAGTPFDFRRLRPIGSGIDDDHPQIKHGPGYDHNFVLNGPPGVLRKVAVLYDPASGRSLTVSTTEPGLQFYAGNFLDGSIRGKNGAVYGRRHGLCLETQHFPDSPNQPEFPSTVLRPGRVFTSTTVYAFAVGE